jgi:hypothetical protein
MSQILTLKLPAGTSIESGKALEAEIKQIDGIKSAGVQQTRGVAELAVWFGIAKPVMEVIKKIIDAIRGKGLTGVEIILPNNGGVVKADSASLADIEKLLKAVRGAS